MAREGIGHAGAEMHARGVLGEDRQGRIDLAIEALVGDPQRVVAVGFGELGALDHLRDRHVAQHQQFERHHAASFQDGAEKAAKRGAVQYSSSNFMPTSQPARISMVTMRDFSLAEIMAAE